MYQEQDPILRYTAPDRFVAAFPRTDQLRVYECDIGAELPHPRLIYHREHVNLIRCLDVYDQGTKLHPLAVGHATGSVTVFPSEKLVGSYTLEPRIARPCIDVSFSTTGAQLLVALEAAKNDPSINVWDLKASRIFASIQYSGRETVQCAKFFKGSLSQSLCAGIGSNKIAIYDIRASTISAQLTIDTPCTRKISIDPYVNSSMFAACSKDAIQLLDARYTANSVLDLSLPIGHSRIISDFQLYSNTQDDAALSVLLSNGELLQWRIGRYHTSESVESNGCEFTSFVKEFSILGGSNQSRVAGDITPDDSLQSKDSKNMSPEKVASNGALTATSPPMTTTNTNTTSSTNTTTTTSAAAAVALTTTTTISGPGGKTLTPSSTAIASNAQIKSISMTSTKSTSSLKKAPLASGKCLSHRTRPDSVSDNTLIYLCTDDHGQFFFYESHSRVPRPITFSPFNFLASGYKTSLRINTNKMMILKEASSTTTTNPNIVKLSKLGICDQHDNCPDEIHRIQSKVDRSQEDELDDADDNASESSSNSSTISQPDASEVLFSFNRVIKEDQMVVMLNRAQQGYRFDFQKNAELSPDQLSKEMWAWVRCNQMLSDNLSCRNIDFRFQGIYGLWKSFPRQKSINEMNANNSIDDVIAMHGNHDSTEDNEDDVDEYLEHVSSSSKMYNLAAQDIVERLDLINTYIAVTSKNSTIRKLSLATLGYSFSHIGLEEHLTQLEKRCKYQKSAFLALCHGLVERAALSLSRGPERLKLVSTALAGFAHRSISATSGSSLWRDLCRDLSIEMADPYVRAIFAYVASSDWKDVLDEQSLPLRDRISVALRFLDDDELSSYLTDLCGSVIRTGDLEGIILTGITRLAIPLLANFVNKTCDVQTAAIISSLVRGPLSAEHKAQIEIWTDLYRSVLNANKMCILRALFDSERSLNSVLSKSQRFIPTIKIRCYFCNYDLSSLLEYDHRETTMSSSQRIGNGPASNPQLKSQSQSRSPKAVCPSCHKPLPRCAVCLLPLSVTESIKDWFSFCIKCSHAMHLQHSNEWFSKHVTCPIPDCKCVCSN